jgi:hypothetical protein
MKEKESVDQTTTICTVTEQSKRCTPTVDLKRLKSTTLMRMSNRVSTRKCVKQKKQQQRRKNEESLNL